ncbi:MAG: sensor histidine kinase [Bacteroidetes bacterium]|nr:sensor histidine kinase [Bacteroidota bacterium]
MNSRIPPLGILLLAALISLALVRLLHKRKPAASSPAEEEEPEEQLQRRAIIEGQDAERQRISRELHDGIGQMLNALNFKVNEVVKDELAKQQLISMVDETRNEIRRMSNNLMPSVLGDFGLVPALKLLAKNSLQHAGTFVELRCQIPEDRRYNPSLEMAVYRIAQEALSNVMKHAKTKEATLLLEERNAHVLLQVTDHGLGFDAAQAYKHSQPAHHGLRNMRERTELLGGIFSINSNRGKGTRISVSFPLTLSSH